MRENFFTILRKGESKMSNIIWANDQISYIVEQYQKNNSTTEIAKQFNVSSEAIRTVLRKQKIHVLTLSELQTKDYPRNSNYFNKIDTPEKAYWLGFLYADGCITKENEIRLGLNETDEEHVIRFKNVLGAVNHKIIKGKKTIDGKDFIQSIFSIKDKQLATDLNKLGCMPGKTKLLTFPNYKQVPLWLMPHFIRGEFDGDGSINYSVSSYQRKTDNGKAHRWKLQFVGTPAFLNGLKKVLNKDNLALEYHSESFAVLSIGGNNQVEELGHYLWDNATEDIALPRKKEKFIQFLTERLEDEPIIIGCGNDNTVSANGETLNI